MSFVIWRTHAAQLPCLLLILASLLLSACSREYSDANHPKAAPGAGVQLQQATGISDLQSKLLYCHRLFQYNLNHLKSNNPNSGQRPELEEAVRLTDNLILAHRKANQSSMNTGDVLATSRARPVPLIGSEKGTQVLSLCQNYIRSLAKVVRSPVS